MGTFSVEPWFVLALFSHAFCYVSIYHWNIFHPPQSSLLSKLKTHQPKFILEFIGRVFPPPDFPQNILLDRSFSKSHTITNLTGKLTVLPLCDFQAVVLSTVVNVAVIDQKALTLNRLLLLVHQFNVLTVENEFNGLLDLLIVLGL